jgi:hypothetical protein
MWLAERTLASQDVLCSKELVSYRIQFHGVVELVIYLVFTSLITTRGQGCNRKHVTSYNFVSLLQPELLFTTFMKFIRSAHGRLK